MTEIESLSEWVRTASPLLSMTDIELYATVVGLLRVLRHRCGTIDAERTGTLDLVRNAWLDAAKEAELNIPELLCLCQVLVTGIGQIVSKGPPL